jgi:hypothetical protein
VYVDGVTGRGRDRLVLCTLRSTWREVLSDALEAAQPARSIPTIRYTQKGSFKGGWVLVDPGVALTLSDNTSGLQVDTED